MAQFLMCSLLKFICMNTTEPWNKTKYNIIICDNRHWPITNKDTIMVIINSPGQY